MRSSFVAATGLALLLAAATYAQAPAVESQAAPSAPPADAPMDTFTPPGSKAPSEGWVEGDKTADAAAKGLQHLQAVQKAYAGAGDLAQDVVVAMMLPQQGVHKQNMNIRFSKANDMKFTSEGIEIVVVGDKAYIALDSVKDKYLEVAKTGTIGETLAAALPGFMLPTPVLAYREGTGSVDVLAPIGMGALENARVVGSRTGASPATTEVLLAGDNGEAAVIIDPATNLIKTCALQITPPGLPPEIRFNIDITLTDTVGPLSAPIAFTPGERTKVASVQDLAGAPPQVEEESPLKVKIGDVAPAAELAMLDGAGKVNLASLKGKVVVIDFWATWCGPCRRGLPILQEFANKMKDNPKVVVYAVNTMEVMSQGEPSADEIAKARTKAADFWAKQKFTLPCLFDSTSSLIGEYGFTGIPATVVIDPTGNIAALHLGFSPNMGEMLEADVAKALAAGSPAADTSKPAAPAGQ